MEKQTFVVAVDGSDVSKACFDAAAKFYRKNTSIIVIHIADRTKTYLPFELGPEQLEESFKLKCVTRFPTHFWKVIVKNKGSTQTTRDALMDFVRSKDVSADVLFVGWVGRKGPKDDPTILGTNTDYSLRAAHCSAFVVKSKEPIPDASVIVVGVDGSARAHETVERVLKTMARPGDKVMLVHCAEGTSHADTPSSTSAIASSSLRSPSSRLSTAAASAAAAAAAGTSTMPTYSHSTGLAGITSPRLDATSAATSAGLLSPTAAAGGGSAAAGGAGSVASAASSWPVCKVTEDVRAAYEEYCKEHPNTSFHLVHRAETRTLVRSSSVLVGSASGESEAYGPAEALVAFAEEHDAAILAVGVDGMGRYTSSSGAREKAGLGSVSDAVVRKARCDVFVVQPTRATY